MKDAGLKGALLAALLVMVAVPAQAKKYVYSPIVHMGEKELEYYVDWHEDAATGTTVLTHELEFVYVYTEKDSLSLYGVWSGESAGGGGADSTHFTTWKVEWTHQLFEQGERSWDAGIYVEYAVNADTSGGSDKIEFKPLLQKSFDRLTLTLNGVLEKELDNRGSGGGGGGTPPPGLEAGYAAQLKYRMDPAFEPMIEFYGGVGELGDMQYQNHAQLVGPVVNINLGRSFTWQVGALFGTTDASEDVRIKSNIAFEWY